MGSTRKTGGYLTKYYEISHHPVTKKRHYHCTMCEHNHKSAANVLNLEDEHGGDEKLICVPIDTTFPYYSDVAETKDLPSIIFQQIEHFFTHYKDLEKEKWVRIGNWGDAAEAKRIVIEAVDRYKAEK